MRSLALTLAAAQLVAGCDAVSGLSDFVVDSAGGGGGSGGAGGAMSSGGNGGGGGTTDVPASCADVQGKTGVHAIDPDGDGGNAPFDAFCQQGLADGGWTLVGRSANGGEGDFGWGIDAGSVDDNSQPYSLDVLRAGLSFTSVLLVAPGSPLQAWRIDGVADDFVTVYNASAWETSGAITLVEGCMTSDGAPAMLTNMGFTGRNDVFFFRDQGADDGAYGLFPGGWGLNNSTDCNYAGGLDGRRGALYVR
jgi:hypothetical protein